MVFRLLFGEEKGEGEWTSFHALRVPGAIVVPIQNLSFVIVAVHITVVKIDVQIIVFVVVNIVIVAQIISINPIMPRDNERTRDLPEGIS